MVAAVTADNGILQAFVAFPANVTRHHPGLLLVLVIYLTLAFSYFFIVPIFEAPDEWTHTGHIEHIAEGNGLPVMLPGQGIWGGQQPPLYYALGALLVQPFEIDGVKSYEERSRNPHAAIGFALDPGNKNNYLHAPSENFPYRGLPLTVHVLRLYSMAFGLVALVFIYFSAYDFYKYGLCPPNPDGSGDNQSRLNQSKFFAFTVSFFVVCQPMFTFITASVANEPANIALSAVALWLTQRYVLFGPTSNRRRAVALGLSLGLISLSKMTGLSFGLVAVVAFLQVAVATRNQPQAARLLWRDGIIVGLLFLAVGGWWYWRNYQLYGDFFQRGLYKLYFNVDPQPLSLSQFIYTLSTGEVSFWATFGWLNIVAPDLVYSFYRIVSRVGLAGVIVANMLQIGRWLRGRRPGQPAGQPQSAACATPLLIHLIFPLALAFSLTRLVATEGGLQGRQLLPALGSISILIGWGWWVLTPARLRRPVLAALAAVLLGLALWLPYGLVWPAYVPKPLLTEADLPAGLPRRDLIFVGEIKLIGAQLEIDAVRPGERVPVTVYWQALKPMSSNYSVFVHLIGRGYENVGQLNTYPGLGLRPTTTLQPGQIVRDTYPVLVNGGSPAPARLLVNVGLFDINEPGRPGIPPVSVEGKPATSTVGQLKLVPHAWPAVDRTTPLARFEDHIWLIDYRLDQCRAAGHGCQLTLRWLAGGRPSTDYTVFIQLWPATPSPDGPSFYGFDSPPLNNDYPTGLWQADEVIIDPHPLDLASLPAGEYQLLVGLYQATTGDRLPVIVNATALPDRALNLGMIVIE